MFNKVQRSKSQVVRTPESNVGYVQYLSHEALHVYQTKRDPNANTISSYDSLKDQIEFGITKFEAPMINPFDPIKPLI